VSTYQDLLGTVVKANSGFEALAAEESDNNYLGRLTQAVSMTTKDQFEAMPVAAQEWFDAAADALNADKDVPVPEGYAREAILAPVRPVITRPRALAPVEVPAPAPVEAPAPVVAAAPEVPEPVEASEPVEVPEPVSATAAKAVTAAPEAPAPAPARPGRRRDGHGVSKRIRQLVIEDPEVTVGDILERLKAENYPNMSEKRTTISTLRYDTLVTLSIVKELGWSPQQR
jgi:hypothetical protein